LGGLLGISLSDDWLDLISSLLLDSRIVLKLAEFDLDQVLAVLRDPCAFLILCTGIGRLDQTTRGSTLANSLAFTVSGGLCIGGFSDNHCG
jgi:hypothetical protein